MSSANVEEYMEALYRLGAADGPVATGDLADSMGVVAPSVTTMLKRLVRDGLVTHEPYKGITLTEAGREFSRSLVRRHRLSERLLTDMIGMSWDKVHDVACKLEHVIAGDLEDDLYKALGEPRTCPHGHPIDGGETADQSRLLDVPAGQSVCISRVAEQSPEFLKYLADLGLMPGNEVKVVSISPVGDVITIECDSRVSSIGKDISSRIWVAPCRAS